MLNRMVSKECICSICNHLILQGGFTEYCSFFDDEIENILDNFLCEDEEGTDFYCDFLEEKLKK